VLKGEAILVCAYDDLSKFRAMRLDGSVSFQEFAERLPSLEKGKEIIFYCACPREASAAGLAARYREEGFPNTRALGGGVDAWKAAGFPVAPAG
jgi:rhodanese-related sulfurtransferase